MCCRKLFIYTVNNYKRCQILICMCMQINLQHVFEMSNLSTRASFELCMHVDDALFSAVTIV